MTDNHLEYSDAVIGSTGCKLHDPISILDIVSSPCQTVHCGDMAQEWMKAQSWRSRSSRHSPQFYEPNIHPNGKKPAIAGTTMPNPWQRRDAVFELWKNHELFNRSSVLDSPDLHCPVPWTCCKFMAVWVPGACPYNSLVRLVPGYKLITNFSYFWI